MLTSCKSRREAKDVDIWYKREQALVVSHKRIEPNFSVMINTSKTIKGGLVVSAVFGNVLPYSAHTNNQYESRIFIR